MTVPLLRLGVHVSISGGIEKAVSRARELGCSAMQIFSRNPRGWKTSPLDPQSVRAFREAAGKSNIDPIVIHTPYLLNLASGDGALHRQSIKVLAEDLKRAEDLGVRFVVTHLGSGKEKSRASSPAFFVRAELPPGRDCLAANPEASQGDRDVQRARRRERTRGHLFAYLRKSGLRFSRNALPPSFDSSVS